MSKAASVAAFVAAATFAALFASFSLPRTPGFMEIRAVLGVTSHALLLPIIAALAAPAWARVGGYAWAGGDIILNVAALNASALTPDFFTFAMALRYGLHVCAGIWLLAAAASNAGALRWGCAGVGVALGGFSFVAPFAPSAALYPVMMLVVAWLVLVGWRLRVSPGSPSPLRQAPAA